MKYLFLLLLPSLAFAHGGGLSNAGCHRNNTLGVYQCHQGEFAGMEFKSAAQAIQALGSEPDWTQYREISNEGSIITVEVMRGPLVCEAIFIKPQSIKQGEDWGTFSNFQACRIYKKPDPFRP